MGFWETLLLFNVVFVALYCFILSAYDLKCLAHAYLLLSVDSRTKTAGFGITSHILLAVHVVFTIYSINL